MDIFIEIVTNPDGFAFTHSMVRAPMERGEGVSSGEGQGKVTVASGASPFRDFLQRAWLRAGGLRCSDFVTEASCPPTSCTCPGMATTGSLCSGLSPKPDFTVYLICSLGSAPCQPTLSWRFLSFAPPYPTRPSFMSALPSLAQ
jgi:hypothetical protein